VKGLLGREAVLGIAWAVPLLMNVSLVFVSLVFPRSKAAAPTTRLGMAPCTPSVPAVVFLSTRGMTLFEVPSQVGKSAKGAFFAFGHWVGTFELFLVDEDVSDRFLAVVRTDRWGSGAAVGLGGRTERGRDVRHVDSGGHLGGRKLWTAVVSRNWVAQRCVRRLTGVVGQDLPYVGRSSWAEDASWEPNSWRDYRVNS